MAVLIVLSACAGSPPNLYPSIKLLDEHDYISGELLSLAVAADLDKAPYGSKLRSGQLNMTVLEDYTSAMGQRCRRVLLAGSIDSAVEKRVACVLGSGWYLYPSLL